MSTPVSTLTVAVPRRNPFRLIRLPWTCQQYLALHFTPARPGLLGHLRQALRYHLLRIARRVLTEESGAFSVQIDGTERTLSFNPANTQFHSIYAPLYRHGYDPETGALIDLLLPADGVMFDIGANWGHFSLHAASRPGFRGQIHAFEPMPETYADLAATIRGAQLEAVVHLHPLALSDTAGEARMILPDGEHSGLATITSRGDGIPMQRATLDSLGLSAPDFMKIDVEGHEAAMLRGAEQTIRQARPMIVFESTMGPSGPESLAPFFFLEACDYRFFHPALRDRQDGHEYFAGSDGSAPEGLTLDLALIPFRASERLLHARYFNVLACHKSRLPELASVLQKVTSI